VIAEKVTQLAYTTENTTIEIEAVVFTLNDLVSKGPVPAKRACGKAWKSSSSPSAAST
jgi:hypothetical protein